MIISVWFNLSGFKLHSYLILYFLISSNSVFFFSYHWFIFKDILFLHFISHCSCFTVNVALNKPAYQQNAYLGGGDDKFDASNAVDGRKSDLSWDGCQCVLSADFKHTATWWVDLTSIFSIHYITIYYRTDNVAWRKLLIAIEIHILTTYIHCMHVYLLIFKPHIVRI